MEPAHYINPANCLAGKSLRFTNRSPIDNHTDTFTPEKIEVVNVAYLRWNPASLAFLYIHRERSFYGYESKTL